MKTTVPLASILINNYNYGRFLRGAIDSALNQTYPNTEVIVVDDGSTDESREIIATYGKRIIPILKENGGQASAFNAGFAASKGEWIHFLDSDDLLLANKVERVSELVAEGPALGLIAHNLDYCTGEGMPLDYHPPLIRERRFVDNRQGSLRGHRIKTLPATSGLCIRRDILQRVLPMPEEIRITADNYLKLAVPSLAPALLVPEILATQRIHGRNLYTLATTDRGEAALLRCVVVNAMIGFHLGKEHPSLARLAWKQYGWLLCQIVLCRSKEARTVEVMVRARYSVMDLTPACFFYVLGSFTKGLVRVFLQASADALVTACIGTKNQE